MSTTRLWCPETLEDQLIWQHVARKWKPATVMALSVLKRAAWKSDQTDSLRMSGACAYSYRRDVLKLRRQS